MRWCARGGEWSKDFFRFFWVKLTLAKGRGEEKVKKPFFFPPTFLPSFSPRLFSCIHADDVHVLSFLRRQRCDAADTEMGREGGRGENRKCNSCSKSGKRGEGGRGESQKSSSFSVAFLTLPPFRVLAHPISTPPLFFVRRRREARRGELNLHIILSFPPPYTQESGSLPSSPPFLSPPLPPPPLLRCAFCALFNPRKHFE